MSSCLIPRPVAAGLGAALLTVLIAGCNASLPGWLQGRSNVEDGPGVVEPIRAAAVSQDSILFWITTDRCTAKSDLIPVVRQTYDGTRVTLRRISNDGCADASSPTPELRWSFEEIGIEPGTRVRVANPYRPEQG